MHYGIDVGGTKTEFAVFDSAFEPLNRSRVATHTEDYEKFLSTIRDLVLAEDARQGEACSVGVGFNGIVDCDGLSYSVNVPCLNRKRVKNDLAEVLGRPVGCLNDVRAFALSEARGGAGHGYETVVGMVLGTGVMGTFCRDGVPRMGASGVAGEWGHVPVSATLVRDLDLPLFECACGLTACTECYISGPGLERLARHFLNRDISSRDCIALMRSGDAAAGRVFDAWIDLVASSISQVILHQDPEAIVIGGGMSCIDEIFIRLPQATKKFLFEGVNVPPILKARYGDASGVRGAAIHGAGE